MITINTIQPARIPASFFLLKPVLWSDRLKAQLISTPNILAVQKYKNLRHLKDYTMKVDNKD